MEYRAEKIALQIDRVAYPFKDHYFESRYGLIHYVDEGNGYPILMLHGNPAWSFVYRKWIKKLSGDFRCIAPDLPGLGLSVMHDEFDYSPQSILESLKELISYLALKRYSIIINDWGGPLGIQLALVQKKKVDKLVILNSWAWKIKSIKLRLFSNLFGNSFIGLSSSLSWMLPYLFVHFNKSTGKLKQQYLLPFQLKSSRTAASRYARNLTSQKDFFEKLEKHLGQVKGKPVLIIWGMKDPAFGSSVLRKWQKIWPQATLKKISSTGHLPQESENPELISTLIEFLRD